MENFQHGGHVHAESPAQPFLQSIPPANGILRGSTPRFNRPFGRRLLLVRAPEKHPVAARLEHRMQVVDAPKVIPELRAPRLDDERGWIERLVTKRQKLRRSARRLQMPRMLTRTRSRTARLAFARHFSSPRKRCSPLVNDANETTLPISTIRRLQVTALSERFSLSAAVSRVRDSPKNGRHARAFP